MSFDSWLKLHTSLLLSQKYRGLPSNDHRLVFVHHLMFQARKLLGDDPSLLACLCNLPAAKYLQIMSHLNTVGLLNDDGSVVDFERKQVSQDAMRKRMERSRDMSRTSPVTSHGDADADADVEKEADAEKKKEPRAARARPAPRRKKPEPDPNGIPEQIIAYCGKVTGRNFQIDNRGFVKMVNRAIKEDGCTLDQAKRVIDYKWAEWGPEPERRDYVNPVTLFRKANFLGYLGLANAGQAKAAPPKDAALKRRYGDTEEKEQIAWMKKITGED